MLESPVHGFEQKELALGLAAVMMWADL